MLAMLMKHAVNADRADVLLSGRKCLQIAIIGVKSPTELIYVKKGLNNFKSKYARLNSLGLIQVDKYSGWNDILAPPSSHPSANAPSVYNYCFCVESSARANLVEKRLHEHRRVPVLNVRPFVEEKVCHIFFINIYISVKKNYHLSRHV